MRILKPVRVADMNDDYQDARLLSQDRDSCTVQITYYPFNKNREAISESPNWRHDDAGMTDYLRPTPTENWDEAMRRDLIAKLKADGIDPDRLTDRELVQRVSTWALQRAQTTQAFSAWYVSFPNGRPVVPASLRTAFNQEKPAPDWSDQRMFDQEVLGKQMYYGRVHGACTSSSVYLATILRALGIPTRIVVCIPPVDPNDPAQVKQFLAQIHHHAVHDAVENGITGARGWSNHLFNEVYVGRHWVRLNYNTLGQNILDQHYFGLLTHIYTCNSLSEMPLADTWGRRYALYENSPAITPRLTSVNPYMLLSVSDHFGRNAQIANPVVVRPDLHTATVIGIYGQDSAAIPDPVKKMAGPNDLFILIREWLPDQDYHQLRRFIARASHRILLKAPGHPDVELTLDGSNFNTSDSASPNGMLKGFVARIMAGGTQPEPGVVYTVQAQNTTAAYSWSVDPGVRFPMGR
jgi:hypothetical protein